MEFFKQLQQETQEEQGYLLSSPIITQCMHGQVSMDGYIGFLTQAYHHVKHTVPLFMACGSRLPERLEWLREAVAEYIDEEIGHQEWILNDLQACGVDKEIIRNSEPNFETELMVSYAYDTVTRNNPVGLFGMVNVLEGTSISLATNAASIIQKKLNLDDKAFSYLNSHGSLDIKHVEFYEGLMNKLDNDGDKQAIIHCAKVVYILYANIFRSLPLSDESPNDSLEKVA
ncbi:MAG: iron-containing redox enzyme family protein [Gammaproteobacteria bacterium]|nr:iron-containing redox enzyme family protein [Gammaproteobacteria bacterium]NNC68931.1 iron-containing redox enzyme family protein [Gammaproteobacteria bacterium]